ncbi:MAG: DUF6491 family protein, partial [Phenylobacterium sp.]
VKGEDAMRASLLLLLAAAAASAPAMTADKRACFSLQRLQNTQPYGDSTIYLRVGVKEYWRLDTAHRCSALLQRNGIILTPAGGEDMICSPIQLDLRVRDIGGGASTPCLIGKMTRLTPEEASRIPPKARP